MEKLALQAEADSLEQTAAEYEKLLGTNTPADHIRATAVIVFRGMATAKRAAAAVLA